MHPYPDGLGHEVNDSPRQPPRNGGNRPETSTLSGSKRLCLISGLQINSPIGERYEVQNGSTEKDGSEVPHLKVSAKPGVVPHWK